MSYIFPNCFVCRLTSASRHCSLMCNWASPNKSIIFCFFKQTCSNLYGKPWVNKETILRIRPPSELTSRPTTDYYYSPRWRQRVCCLSAGRRFAAAPTSPPRLAAGRRACNAPVRIFQMSKTMIKTVHTPLFFYCATLIEYIDYYGAITS